MDRNVTWTELWRAEPQRIKFLVQAALASPSNFFIGGKVENLDCMNAQARGNWNILRACISGTTIRSLNPLLKPFA